MKCFCAAIALSLLITATHATKACSKVLCEECCNERSNRTECAKCVDEKHVPIDAANCSYSEISSFCNAKPGPTPAEGCAPTLEHLCGVDRHSEELCTKCVARNKKAVAGAHCTAKQEVKFCEGAPPPPPPVETCDAELEKFCGLDRQSPTLCLRCVETHENITRAAHCTFKQVDAFCNVPAPPNSNGCALELSKHCGAERDSKPKCEACVRKSAPALKEHNCTSTQEQDYCDPPAPHGKQCTEALHKDCGKEQRVLAQCFACTEEHKAGLAGAHCSAAAVSAFCRPPPSVCEAAAAVVCGKTIQNVSACAACCQENAGKLKAEGCTPAEEMQYCATGPSPSPPRDCPHELEALCGLNRRNKTMCAHCVADHLAPLREHHCTAEVEANFCAGPPAPKPTPGKGCEKDMEKFCGAVQKEGGDKCLSCLDAHAKALSQECSVSTLLSFCTPAPGPAPAPTSCAAEMIHLCEAQRKTKAACQGCLSKPAHQAALQKAKCTLKAEAAFC